MLALLMWISQGAAYIEEVMDCVDNTCAEIRKQCGIDEDCR